MPICGLDAIPVRRLQQREVLEERQQGEGWDRFPAFIQSCRGRLKVEILQLPVPVIQCSVRCSVEQQVRCRSDSSKLYITSHTRVPGPSNFQC